MQSFELDKTDVSRIKLALGGDDEQLKVYSTKTGDLLLSAATEIESITKIYTRTMLVKSKLSGLMRKDLNY